MGGEAFKRRLAPSVAVLIAAWNNFVVLLKGVITKVLKYVAHLKTMYALPYVP